MYARLFSKTARPPPQAGQTKPYGQRRSNRKFAQLVSSGKLAWNSVRDRALATQSSHRARWGYLTTYSVTWDSGISLPLHAINTSMRRHESIVLRIRTI